MGKTLINGFYLDAGWGSGVSRQHLCVARRWHTVANDRNHDLIKDFSLFGLLITPSLKGAFFSGALTMKLLAVQSTVHDRSAEFAYGGEIR